MKCDTLFYAVVVAAGNASRMGIEENKVFLPLTGRPVLLWVLEALDAHEGISGTVVVTKPGEGERVRELIARRGLARVVAVVDGGKTRTESVLLGLNEVPDEATHILVQDGARPFLTRDILDRCMKSAVDCGSGVAAIAVTDTVKLVDADETVAKTPDRSMLRAVQTPQAFNAQWLRDAYRAGLSGTDDAALVEAAGHPVKLVEGSRNNLKITTKEDYLAAQHIAKNMMKTEDGVMMPAIRVGQGYDVHRLISGRKLILCGIEVPHDVGLEGHSDADVATHALMDALVGAAGLGDIGGLFPDNDAAYKDISSILLLGRVMTRLFELGYVVVNADVTIMAQAPKLIGYRKQMIDCIAGAMQVDVSCVNVKATTTEGLGFVGQKEGMAALAAVLLSKRSCF